MKERERFGFNKEREMAVEWVWRWETFPEKGRRERKEGKRKD